MWMYVPAVYLLVLFECICKYMWVSICYMHLFLFRVHVLVCAYWYLVDICISGYMSLYMCLSGWIHVHVFLHLVCMSLSLYIYMCVSVLLIFVCGSTSGVCWCSVVDNSVAEWEIKVTVGLRFGCVRMRKKMRWNIYVDVCVCACACATD